MLEIVNLQKVLDGKITVHIASFHLLPGQIAGVTARPGSGLDTLIAVLTGQTQSTAGSIRINGLDPYSNRQAVMQMSGVMFAEDSLYKNLSAIENLRFQARLFDIPLSCASEILSRVGLADQKNVQAGKLSSSLLRRLAFGRAILHSPGFILLIDPFARCDSGTIDLLSSQILSLAKDGAAILIFANDDANLTSLCEHHYQLQDGHLLPVTRSSEETLQRQPFRIPVKVEDKVLLINPAEVLYADASQGRAFLVTLNDRILTQFTLLELETRLKHSGFFRAHRAYLVNLQHVREVIPFTRNTYSLRLDVPDGTQIPLSKAAAAELRNLLGF